MSCELATGMRNSLEYVVPTSKTVPSLPKYEICPCSLNGCKGPIAAMRDHGIEAALSSPG